MKFLHAITISLALALVGAPMLDAAHEHDLLNSPDADCVLCVQHADAAGPSDADVLVVYTRTTCTDAAPAHLTARPAPVAIARGPPLPVA